MLRRPGSSWGFGALLKDTSVVVLKVERALYIHSPHPPHLKETQTHDLWIISPTLYPLGHDFPNCFMVLVLANYYDPGLVRS